MSYARRKDKPGLRSFEAVMFKCDRLTEKCQRQGKELATLLNLHRPGRNLGLYSGVHNVLVGVQGWLDVVRISYAAEPVFTDDVRDSATLQLESVEFHLDSSAILLGQLQLRVRGD